MKKLTIMLSILMINSGISISGISAFHQISEKSTIETEEILSIETLEETDFSEEASEFSSDEIVSSTEINTEETIEIEENSSAEREEIISATPQESKNQISFAAEEENLQDADGYWLVGDAATLRTYIVTDKKKELRLTADINIGATGFPLYDGFILDGDGHTLTYDKGGSTTSGFYLQVADATVMMKNIHFGTPDGKGATGYYGIITGFDGYANMKMIFENTTYTTTNGQAFYNINGQIIFRGNNTFTQTGSSGYSQEFAETNYMEVESGTTKIVHDTTNLYGFIYAHGTNSSSPYANSANVVVRSNASLDIETSHTFFYSAANYNQSIIVEDNAAFKVKQTGTEATRRRFIYPDLGTNAVTNFQFGANSVVQMDLKIPIPLNNSRGGMTIGEGAAYAMKVEAGKMFSLGTSGTFSLNMNNVKLADFNGTEDGTLGLRSSHTSTSNLFYNGTNRMKVNAYDLAGALQPSKTFNKVDTALYATNAVYQNISGDMLSADELNALATSKRLTFQSVWVPDILSTSVSNVTAKTAQLAVSSENYGLPATEVKYLLFTNEADIGTFEKAKHIYTVDSTQIQDSIYLYQTNELNPNTTYWYQAIVTNENGRSELSQPTSFQTLPDLTALTSENITETSATISGSLANNTGFWTDYSHGEEASLPNQQADYGGTYDNEIVFVEYSRNIDFSEAVTNEVINRFGENASQFTVDLTALRPDTTYYVRAKARNSEGREIIFPIVHTFATLYGEYMDVTVPVEMLFGTNNKEATTEKGGTIYSKGSSYEIKNQGNIDTTVSITGFTPRNEAAPSIRLLDTMDGTKGANELALKLLAKGSSQTETFLTTEIQNRPQLIGTMNHTDKNLLQLDFSGKFFNPLGEVLQPSYTMTLKFEKTE